ncbi:hypothetical protein VA7868_00370 [Vibrio aerogenes CECT 7868]|uniref:Uncharacterized protein n=2 Tax=Vibrio aerogenes TaxID=92172 RepID=A0A1M5VF94_9VIBR|nr:hypothetical protein [Vibrio aerogenes]SHH73845.1 hypothetical protein VA7868_00370 [Vibrio aerogenes CECT 7868]
MRPLIRFIAHLVFFIGLSLLVLFPRHQYEWTPGMKPSVSVIYDDVITIHSILFMLMVLGVMIISQLGLIAMSTNSKERKRSLLFIVASIVIWFLWYSE